MPKKISNKKPSSTITIETKHESSIYNTPPPSSKNKKKEEEKELINAGTLGRPIGRPSPFQQKYIQKALAKAKFSAQLDTPEADKQFENANDWCTKLQHRVLSLYSDKQKQFERNRLVQRLYRACTKGNAYDVRALLEEDNAILEMKNFTGLACLIVAAFNGSADVMQVLVDYNANLNERDQNGNTSLHLACQQSAFRISYILINGGIDVNAINKHGKTVLHYSILSQQHKYVQMLLLHVKNLDCSIKDVLGMTPLLLAIEMKDYELVKMLLESSSNNISSNNNINNKHDTTTNNNNNNQKRIGTVTGSNGTKFIHYKYKQNANPNDSNLKGETCLMLCAMGNVQIPIVKLLLDHGANVNARDKRDETVLMYAVQRGQEELVLLLLSYGADKFLINRQKDNSIDLAILLEKKRIVNILNNRRGSYASSVEVKVDVGKKITPRYLRKAQPITRIILPKIQKYKVPEKKKKKKETKLERERRKARERRFERQRKRQSNGINVGFYTIQRRRLKEEAELQRQKELLKEQEEKLKLQMKKRNEEKEQLLIEQKRLINIFNCKKRKQIINRLKEIDNEALKDEEIKKKALEENGK